MEFILCNFVIDIHWSIVPNAHAADVLVDLYSQQIGLVSKDLRQMPLALNNRNSIFFLQRGNMKFHIALGTQVVFTAFVGFSMLGKYPSFGRETKQAYLECWKPNHTQSLVYRQKGLNQVRGMCWSTVVMEAQIVC